MSGVTKARALKAEKGFSLIEIVIVFFVSLLLIGGLFATLSSSRNTWHRADAQIMLQEELRRGMRQIVRDLRQSGTSQISLPDNGLNYTSVSFNVTDGVLSSGAVDWNSDEVFYNLSAGQVLRTQGADTRVIANKVGSANFSRSGRVVNVYLQCQTQTPSNQVYSANLNSSVVLRNE